VAEIAAFLREHWNPLTSRNVARVDLRTVSEAAERLERDGLAMRVGPLVALRRRLPDGFGSRVELKDNWKELVECRL
jgi:hypothetical protein